MTKAARQGILDKHNYKEQLSSLAKYEKPARGGLFNNMGLHEYSALVIS